MKMLAPIVPHLVEDVHQHLIGIDSDAIDDGARAELRSVFQSRWPHSAEWVLDDAVLSDWTTLLHVRTTVNAALEHERAKKYVCMH
jgi:isoleucyl-tRNA synthetase